MKIKVIKVSKPSFSEMKDLVDIYEKRLSSWVKVDNLVIKKDEDFTLPSGSILVCLDEHGTEIDSKTMASKISGWSQDGRIKNLFFYIGGPYGISKTILNQAKECWSLSRLTFQGDLAWMIFWEQLYRSFCIINGTSYHHE